MAGNDRDVGERSDDPLDRLVETLVWKAKRMAEKIDTEIARLAAEIGDNFRNQS